jgi:hypothetical protein
LFRQELTQNPNDPAIVAAIVRSLLRQQKVSDAAAQIKSALAEAPQSAVLLTALAEVQYRQGLIVESGQSAAAAYNADICYARVHLIRALLASLNSMYATEKKEIVTAHALDPFDPDIRSKWIDTLPIEQRISELKRYLADTGGLDEKERQDDEASLERLEKISASPVRSCRLVSAARSTKLQLESVLGYQLRTRSWALMAKFNNTSAKLELDSGASGLLINRKIADKAGLHAVSSNEVNGFGDSGPLKGFTAFADSIHVGNLEFRDCLVEVTDRNDIENADGLIGTDIFEDFLVSIDIPLHFLELAPLPTRPGETPQTASLQTETQIQNPSADVHTDATENGDSKSSEKKSASSSVMQNVMGPKDRYIAPEMKSWFPIFRIGHDLIVPGLIDKTDMKLFIIDTGSEAMILSEAAASEIRRIYESPETKITGISGEVKHVYTGGAFNFRFADKSMSTREAAILDLSSFSNDTGIEISGFIGLPALKLMTIHIDYRDGLMKFDYDPTTIPGGRGFGEQ